MEEGLDGNTCHSTVGPEFALDSRYVQAAFCTLIITVMILILGQFALTEAGYVIVRLAQKFEEIVGVGNSWESVEKGGYGYVRTKLSLTGCPADGVKVRMKEARE